jgi:hypothetical protein
MPGPVALLHPHDDCADSHATSMLEKTSNLS